MIANRRPDSDNNALNVLTSTIPRKPGIILMINRLNPALCYYADKLRPALDNYASWIVDC